MLFVCNCKVAAAAALLLFSIIDATTITTAPKATSISNTIPATCEFRTINYITDSLPQQCLKSSWSNSNATSSSIFETVGKATVAGEPEGTIIPGSDGSNTTNTSGGDSQESETLNETASITSSLPPTATETEATEESPNDIESGELNEASFLSFEDWKKQTLEKAGQANANIGNKKSGGPKRDSESIQNNLDSLGDEGEIELDFGAFRSGGNGEESPQSSETNEPDAQSSQDLEGSGRKDQHRSNDAGKTCKERYSYASFDAGATILKTHPGAKNSKAVLIENKDSYMLSECAAENKFLIVELSEDIWIDTVVLANYEFFSSMIRTFRVSVSDRYPVKMEKWKDLGAYEARNSRDIQAFLIENPQIWARYLRIEFLSHYGNEYYCPLSLLRVHGTRMLESWKETEASGDDDDTGESEGEEQYVHDAVAEVVQEEERLNAELKGAQAAMDDLVRTAASISDQVDPALTSSHLMDANRSLEDAIVEQMSTPWIKPELELFNLSRTDQELEICPFADTPGKQPVVATLGPESESSSTSETDHVTATAPPSAVSVASPPPNPAATSHSDDGVTESSSSEASSITAASNVTSMTSSIKQSMSSAIASAVNKTSIASSATSITIKPQNVTNSQKNKSTSTSSATSSLPTIQESFFKAVSRRLQLLETNSTLSLKYIEEQSKILREAFTKVEKKQLQKTTSFLDTLNSTVLAELRGFRQQYDEIWQSTIISLESQRDESRREILAISTRLNILADEVVFQKRMSIVQSVLLLLCLGLVIFSRVSAGGHLDFPAMQARARKFGFPLSPLESPPESPEYRRTSSMQDSRQWLETAEPRQHDRSPISRSRSREDDDSPPTPVSFYSRSENALTPPSGADDNMAGSTGNIIGEQSEVPSSSDSKDLQPSSDQAPDPSDEQSFRSSPTVRAPKKRNAYIRRQSSPPPDDIDWTLYSSSEQNRDACDASDQAVHNIGSFVSRLSPLPSLPPEKEIPSFSIARKPLPALPPDGS
jgi:hypothetical protein